MAYCCGRNAAFADISNKTILNLILEARFHSVCFYGAWWKETLIFSGALRFYWINSNKGDKRNTWENNCLLVLCFAECQSMSFMFWNCLTLLLTISSWSLSKGTDFSFWLCQHKCGDEWSDSQVTLLKLSLHLGAECYPQGIRSGWWQ